MSLYALLKGKGPSGFGYGGARSDRQGDTHHRLQFRPGVRGDAGIGATGRDVIGAARSEAKANAACASIPGKETGIACELSEPASVRACAAALKAKGTPLNVIICNTGITALPKLRQAHGYEREFFTNHIGHFIRPSRSRPERPSGDDFRRWA